ncbi:MAG: peptide-methionine (S)-S-oxide reductase MsrA [Pseudomonadota bacterium]
MHTQRTLLIATAAFALVATVGASFAYVAGRGFAGDAKVAHVHLASDAVPAGARVATFAAGCFWCTESDFDKVDGVLSTTSGFIGGTTDNPTYKSVTGGNTGHVEAVRIVYDPKKVSYKKLLSVYWRNVDFLDNGGQFCDRGSSYAPAIFTHSAEQLAAARSSKKTIQTMFDKPVVVPIREATRFTAAEAYHQNFYKKNPFHYYRYRVGCGRDARLKALWRGKPKS